MERRIYLDYNATAKIRPEVIDALARQWRRLGTRRRFTAPGATRVNRWKKRARKSRCWWGQRPNQVVFTSGGTEADNQVMRLCDPTRTFVSAIEHPAVLDSVRAPLLSSSTSRV